MAATSGSPARPSELDDAAEAAVASVLARCGVRLRRAATQTLNDNTLTTVSFDTEDEDTDGFWASGTPTVVTIPAGKGGLYAITFSVDNAAVLSSAARGFVQIVPTSAVTGIGATYRSPIEALGDMGIAAIVIPLNAADTFICQEQADMAAGSTLQAWLSCYRVGL